MEPYIRYLHILQRKQLWIAVIAGSVFLAAFSVALALPNIYQSTTMILVERQKVPETYVHTTVTESMQERLKTISQEILSRTQIRRIIREYGLLAQPVLEERLIARMGLPEQSWVAWTLRQVAALRTRHGLDEKVQLELAVDEFKHHVKIKVVGNQAFSVTYEGRDPVTVMRITNALAGMFIAENLRVREMRAENTTDFLEHQLENARLALEDQEGARQAFRTANMGSLPEQLDANLHTLDRLQAELLRVEGRLGVLAQQRSFIQSQLMGDPFDLDKLPEEARMTLAQLDPLARDLAITEARLANLRTRYTERHPEIIQLRNQAKELRQAITDRQKQAGNKADDGTGLNLERIGQDEADLMAKRDTLERDIAMYQQRVEQTPKVEQELQKLERDYKITEANYQSLLEKKMNARLAESLERRQQGEQFRVIDSANLPVEPVGPNRKLILVFGLVAGLGTGGGWFILRDMLRPTFQSAEDVTAVLGLPVLMVTQRIKELERVR